MLQYHTAEDLSAVYYFVKETLKSKKWRKRFTKLAVKTIHGTGVAVVRLRNLMMNLVKTFKCK
jgi:hypothetical protein